MGVEAALAHADVRGEVPDRESFETLDGGEVGGGAEDRLPAALAVRAGSTIGCRSHRLTS